MSSQQSSEEERGGWDVGTKASSSVVGAFDACCAFLRDVTGVLECIHSQEFRVGVAMPYKPCKHEDNSRMAPCKDGTATAGLCRSGSLDD